MNNQYMPEYSRHPSISKLFITNQDNEIVKEFSEASDVICNYRKELLELQQKYGQDHSDYALGIKNIYQQKNCKKIIVIYDCDKSAIPLSQVKSTIPKQQIQIFKNLYQIYGFLNMKNIQHRNLKPSNVILYKNQLFLTDFCYIRGQWFTDKINFLDHYNTTDKIPILDQQNNKIHQDKLYPYLSPEIAEILNKDKTYGHRQDALKNRHQLSVKKQDQFAIAIMMLEVFTPLNNRDLTSIERRKQQINEINLSSEFTSEDVTLIKNTISELLVYRDFNQDEYINTLNKLNKIEQQVDYNKIDKKVLMNQENQKLVEDCLQNQDSNFDINLLYYFNKIELKHKYNQIQQDESKQELKEGIRRHLKFYQNIDDGKLDYFNQLEKEDQFIILVYLDEKIQLLQNQKGQSIMSETLLQYHQMKRSLLIYYQQLNSMQQNEFKFNKIQQQKDNIDQQINNFQEDNHIYMVNKFQEDIIGQQINNFQENNNDQQNQIDQDDQEDQADSQLNTNNSQQNQLTDLIGNQVPQEILPDIIHVYKIQDQNNPVRLIQSIKEHFQNQNLQLYFEINKCFLQRQQTDDIYKHKKYPNAIFIGKIQDQIFSGEIMQLEENNKMIKHFVKVQTNLNFNQIKDQQRNASIFYYERTKYPENFKKNKEYFGEIQDGKKNGKGEEKNFNENLRYKGYWINDQMVGKGTKEIMNTEFIAQNTPYKWEGNFENYVLNGDDIKTYLLINNKEIWLEGRYENNQKTGTHKCQMKKQLNQQQQAVQNQQQQIVQLYKTYFVNIFHKEYSFKLPCN